MHGAADAAQDLPHRTGRGDRGDVFNGRVSTIDRATGKNARPHLIGVEAERAAFDDLVLAAAGNDFGQTGETLSAASTYYREFIGPWRRHGAATIDASQDLARVVEDLLLAALEAALDLPDRH